MRASKRELFCVLTPYRREHISNGMSGDISLLSWQQGHQGSHISGRKEVHV